MGKTFKNEDFIMKKDISKENEAMLAFIRQNMDLRATSLAGCLDAHTLPHLCAGSAKPHIGHRGPGDQGSPRFLKP